MKFERYEHRNDASIIDGDQEGVKCYLSFVLKDQVKKTKQNTESRKRFHNKRQRQ